MFVREFKTDFSVEMLASKLSNVEGFVWLDANQQKAHGRETEDRDLSFLTAFPQKMVSVSWGEKDVFDSLFWLDMTQTDHAGELVEGLPFQPSKVPCWIGFVSYDAIWSGKKKNTSSLIHERDQSIPVLCFRKYAASFVYSQKENRFWVVGLNEQVCHKLLDAVEENSAPDHSFQPLKINEPDFALHAQAVNKALAEIKKGNIYQINLSQTWHGEFSGSPFAVWFALRKASPVPLGFFFSDEKFTIMARTMECFFNWDKGARTLFSKPIKGTLKRRGDQDEKEAHSLRTNEKEIAEHSMIVDLMRNDLGRLAEAGSVKVEELMQVKPYAGLSHMVSKVQCKTKPSCDLKSIFEALFPPGSITGTPKIEAMNWIEKLESGARSVYTGSVGFVSFDGSASFAVAIRTAVSKKKKSSSVDQPMHTIRYDAGGGIVESSDPIKETEESKLKAAFFVSAWNQSDIR